MARAIPRSEASGGTTLNRPSVLLAAAHALLLVAFFLPWVTGSFGERSTLSGLEIAALSPERASNALLALVGPYAWALYLLPALALDGLVLSLAGERLGLARMSRPLSALLALPGVAVTALVLAYLAMEGSLVDTIERVPAGLLLLMLASTCLGAALLQAAPALLRRPD